MKLVLWAINVYGRLDDLGVLSRLVRDYFGDDVTILVYCNNEDRPERFRTPECDVFLTGPNSGHHDGVRDAYNATVPYVDGHRWVVSSHADNLWSSMEVVDDILHHAASYGRRAAVMSGGPLGAMCDPRNYGYFADWFACVPEVFKTAFPFYERCDGGLWIEVHLARRLGAILKKDEIYDVPCRNVDRLGRNEFVDIEGEPERWMSAGHDLEAKLQKLEACNPGEAKSAREALL
jgi:hypothetical protein